MNVKSFTLNAAALSLAAASFVNAQSLQLVGNVPVDFDANVKSAPAGSYRIVEQRAGLVTIKNVKGQHVAFVAAPVQTEAKSNRDTMTFELKNGAYRFAGYCAAEHGCWSTGTSNAKS